MEKQQIKDYIKEMFKGGEIRIESEVKHSWVSEDLITKVFIDGEKVYEFESEIRLK